MRIELDSIGEQGRRLDVSLALDWAATAAAAAVGVPVSSLSGALMFKAKRDVISVSGDLALAAEHTCERCGSPTTLEVAESVLLTYRPENSDDDAEVELSADDLDVGWYSERRLDAASVLSEAIALSLPSRVTCADVAACDTRTAALLEKHGSSGSNDNPFSVLKGLTA